MLRDFLISVPDWWCMEACVLFRRRPGLLDVTPGMRGGEEAMTGRERSGGFEPQKSRCGTDGASR
jgi:hypothetical protein